MPGPLTADDRFAIQDLLARYAWALDTGDVEGLVACFTPDARMTEEVFEDPDIWVGHDDIRRLSQHYANSPGFPGRQHHLSQLVLDGDCERVNSRAFAMVTECKGEPPYLIRFTGYWEDILVKQDGRWLIAQRTVRLWDGPILKNFPGRGEWVPRKRPPELVIKR